MGAISKREPEGLGPKIGDSGKDRKEKVLFVH